MLSYISRFMPLIKHYRYHKNYRNQLPVIKIPNRYYHKNIVEHYENPRNIGSLDNNKRSVGIGLVGAPACGDVMKLSIDVNDYGVITDAKFKTFGCGSAIASSSYITEVLVGKTIDEAIEIKNKDISQHLKLPPVKLHCSMLAEDSIRAAIKNYKNKQNN